MKKGMSLDFIPPVILDGKTVVQIEESEIAQQTKVWGNVLVLFVIGVKPSYAYMTSYIARTWNRVTAPELFSHDDGWYIAKFQSWDDKNEILYGGPYTLNSKPLILKEQMPNFDFQQDFPALCHFGLDSQILY